MSAAAAAQVAGPAGGFGLAVLILARPRAWRLAGLALWAVGMVIFLPELAPGGYAVRLVGGGVVGVVLAAGLAFLFRRWPWALAFLTLAAVPARIPVTVGSVSADLLIPLYAIVAGAAVWVGWSIVLDERPSRELGRLSWPLALLVAWLGLSIVWTEDVRQGSIELFFFVLPFGLLALALAGLPWNPRALAGLYGLLAGMALLFATVGVWQWATRDVFWNPKVIVANAYAPFYRVNSLFWDPSVYGRFLVVAILASLVLLLFRTEVRWELVAAAILCAAWVGLLFSFSQSSFAALVCGVAIAAAIAWRWRALVAVGLVAAVMIPLGVAAPQFERVRDSVFSSSGSALNRATSGRFGLLKNGLEIYVDHPVAGAGIGSFREAYATKKHLAKKAPPRAASHNTPITIASEAGTIGLVLFGWLVVMALYVAFRGLRGSRTAAAKTRAVTGLGLAAIFVHSLFYNAFLEDPMVWSFFALAVLATAAYARAEWEKTA
ncbi:MAG TPA: O-antigen ligase family protein [Gaiellaceae bacterium]